jgi:hypothetical protein
LIIGLGFFSYYYTSESPTRNPSFFPSQIDFGSVEPSDVPLTAVTTLRNGNNRDFAISAVHSSCGCTVTDVVAGKILHADQEMPVRISFALNDRYGSLKSQILISGSFDGGKTLVNVPIGIKANALQPALVEPLTTILDTNYTGIIPSGSVTIRQGNSRQYQWNDVQFASRELLLTNKVVGMAQVTFQVSPKLNTNMLGAGSDVLVVHLLKDGKRIDFKPLTSNVIWNIRNPNLVKTPSAIYIGAVHPDESRCGNIIVRSFDQSPISNKQLTVSGGDMLEVISRQTSKDVIELDYKIKKGPFRGPISCTIENQVSLHGLIYALRTPIMGYILNH